MVYRIRCAACGALCEGQLVIPTAAALGEFRPVFAGCQCGGEAQGQGRVVEIVG
jgi:hypothetical protein